MGEIFVAEFGGVWVEGAGCGGPEWVDDEGSEPGFEGHFIEGENQFTEKYSKHLM